MALMFDPAGASQQARYKYKKEKQSPGKLKKKKKISSLYKYDRKEVLRHFVIS